MLRRACLEGLFSLFELCVIVDKADWASSLECWKKTKQQQLESSQGWKTQVSEKQPFLFDPPPEVIQWR